MSVKTYDNRKNPYLESDVYINSMILEYLAGINNDTATLSENTTIDVSNKNTLDIEVTGNSVLTLSGAVAGETKRVTLIIENGGGSTFSIANVHYAGGAITYTTSGFDVIELVTIDGGTTWYEVSRSLDVAAL